MSRQLSITLPDELAERLQAKAGKGEASAVIAKALKEHLDEQERIRDVIVSRRRAAEAAMSPQELALTRTAVAKIFGLSEGELRVLFEEGG